jgi:GAF domain-containing protein
MEEGDMKETDTKYVSDFCTRCGEVSCTLDFDEALQTLMRSVENCLGLETSSIHLLDPSGRTVSVTAARNLSDEYLHQEPIRVAEDPVLQEVLGGKVVTLSALPGHPRYESLTKKEGIQSLLCAPLRSRERIIGSLWAFSREPRSFTQEEISYASTLAGQGGVALGNARLHLSLHIISDIGKAITSRFEREEILQRIIRSAAELFGGKGASIFLVNRRKSKLEIQASYGLKEDFYKQKDLEMDDAVLQCLEGIVAVGDVSKEKEWKFPELLHREGIRSVLCSPLRVRGRSIGILRVYMEEVREYSAEDRMFFQILSDFGGIAIENARLYAHIKRDYEDLTRDVWNWYDWGERSPRV